jgi:hypothetical protein
MAALQAENVKLKEELALARTLQQQQQQSQTAPALVEVQTPTQQTPPTQEGPLSGTIRSTITVVPIAAYGTCLPVGVGYQHHWFLAGCGQIGSHC